MGYLGIVGVMMRGLVGWLVGWCVIDTVCVCVCRFAAAGLLLSRHISDTRAHSIMTCPFRQLVWFCSVCPTN